MEWLNYYFEHPQVVIITLGLVAVIISCGYIQKVADAQSADRKAREEAAFLDLVDHYREKK